MKTAPDTYAISVDHGVVRGLLGARSGEPEYAHIEVHERIKVSMKYLVRQVHACNILHAMANSDEDHSSLRTPSGELITR